MKIFAVEILSALVLPVAVACGGGEDSGGTESDPTFAEIHSAIIAPKCNGPLCHATAAGGNLVMINMDAAYTALINQAAAGAECGSSGLVRVVPGDPDGSLLYEKLVNAPCGDQMPPGGAVLEPNNIERIRAWIEAGAKKQ